MKIITGNTKIITTTDWHFDYFEVIKGIYAYRTESYTVRSDEKLHSFSATPPEPVITQGLTKRAGLTALRKGQFPAPAFGNHHDMIVLPDDILAEVKRFGYLSLSARNFKGFDRNENIYEYLATGGAIENVIRFNGSDHTFWRIDGTLLPTGIQFGYIDSRFHNLCYDLPKAVAHLVSRGDVTFFDGEKHRFNEPITSTVADDGTILSIPYYNADGGKNAFLSFVWTPSQEQAEKLYAASRRSDRFKIVFDDDMLGLRAAGAALFDDYYAEIERTRDDDDDDHCHC